MGDHTSYQRHQRHRAAMLEACHRMIGLRVEVDFTPLGSGGRSLGMHTATGLAVGVGSGITIRVHNALVLLLDEPDEAGRRLFLVNARQINHIRRKTFTAVDVEDLISHMICGEPDEKAG